MKYFDRYDAADEPISIIGPEKAKMPLTVNGVEIPAPPKHDFEAVYHAIDREDMSSFQDRMVGRVFVDMDGTLADFDSHYHACFGVWPNKLEDNVDWDLVRKRPHFYRDIPIFPETMKLWNRLKLYEPVILTGIPDSVPEAAENKMAWGRKHLPGAKVICCPAKEKYLHAAGGALLVDDWEKYMHLWTGAGGVWITYRGVPETLAKLTEMGL
jgi:hypothetical protein